MLDRLGYESALVTNGVECVEAMRAGRPFDAILMDIQMPEMDGLDATKAIRDMGSEVPIIALTADAMPDDRARCMAAGMNDYLQKPLRADALEAALARVSPGWRSRWRPPALVSRLPLLRVHQRSGCSSRTFGSMPETFFGS